MCKFHISGFFGFAYTLVLGAGMYKCILGQPTPFPCGSADCAQSVASGQAAPLYSSPPRHICISCTCAYDRPGTGARNLCRCAPNTCHNSGRLPGRVRRNPHNFGLVPVSGEQGPRGHRPAEALLPGDRPGLHPHFVPTVLVAHCRPTLRCEVH